MACPESEVHPCEKTTESKGKALGKYGQDRPETTRSQGNGQLYPLRLIAKKYRRYFHSDKKAGSAKKKPEKLSPEHKQHNACNYIVDVHISTVTRYGNQEVQAKGGFALFLYSFHQGASCRAC